LERLLRREEPAPEEKAGGQTVEALQAQIDELERQLAELKGEA
jgi:polyhydroxyalkanoate synthesis regulator phasin